jgi:hypothetical protein
VPWKQRITKKQRLPLQDRLKAQICEPIRGLSAIRKLSRNGVGAKKPCQRSASLHSSRKVIVPRAASETSCPLLPSNLYFIFVLLHATQELIPLFAVYNRLSKRSSSKTVETVRCRHFSASLARTASACCTRFPASTPRISRTGPASKSHAGVSSWPSLHAWTSSGVYRFPLAVCELGR